jgi:KaiC/GvpD/RAD55 family RecA-like ATPase
VARQTPAAVGSGTNVLVRGDSLAGKRTLGLELLTTLEPDERPVVLALAADADGLRRRLVASDGADVSDSWYVVDAVRSQVDGRTVAHADGGDHRTWYVASPNDLTGLGMATTRALATVAGRGRRPRVLVDSLSTLLQYNSLERTYRFLHVLNGRVAAVGGTTIQVVHSDAHTEQTVATFSHLFDTVVDVTVGEDGTVRVGGTGTQQSLSVSDLLAQARQPPQSVTASE